MFLLSETDVLLAAAEHCSGFTLTAVESSGVAPRLKILYLAHIAGSRDEKDNSSLSLRQGGDLLNHIRLDDIRSSSFDFKEILLLFSFIYLFIFIKTLDGD